ncbi:MAG: stress response translation initiation inhibitor YciH [Candidatus Heimdallarchaeaceae archaeon]
MAEEICPVCGLPKDLCVCEDIAKEEQVIKVVLDTRKWGKKYTVVTGIDQKAVDISSLAKKLKSRLACGGTAKEGRIELQGDHRFKIKDLLVEFGFPSSNIEVQF